MFGQAGKVVSSWKSTSCANTPDIETLINMLNLSLFSYKSAYGTPGHLGGFLLQHVAQLLALNTYKSDVDTLITRPTY